MIGPEPKAVFSSEQRAAIAASIGQTIPAKEQRDICIALMEYYHSLEDVERTAAKEGTQPSKRLKIDRKAKGRKALEQFIYYARELRAAVNCIQYFLKKANGLDKAERIVEDIYELQQIAQRELEVHSSGGGPAQQARENLVRRLGVIYERFTGDKPGRGGPFERFVLRIFQFQKIPSKGIKHVIARVAYTAKSPR